MNRTRPRETILRPIPICSAHDCGRPTYARGLCQTHHRQLLTTGSLKPIRPYRRRSPGTVKLAGNRVSSECAQKLGREAKRRGLSLSAMIAEILEDWHARRAR